MRCSNVGVISDTHGLLREQVKDRLRGCDLIIHAGDVGHPSVLDELREIAEVVAVRGNIDSGTWARALGLIEYVEVDHTCICVVHDVHTLDIDPVAARVNVIVHGHSHQPGVVHKDGILYLNPGSAGPRRFGLPVSMALLHIGPDDIVPQLLEV